MEMFISPIQPMKFSGSDAVSAKGEEASGSSFAGIFSEALQNLEQVTATSDQDSINLALGDVDDLAQVQINAMKAQTMLQTTVQLTTRIVNAYKEIMQMQV